MPLCGALKSLPLQPHHWLPPLLWHPNYPLCTPSSSLVLHSTEVLKNQLQPQFQCAPIFCQWKVFQPCAGLVVFSLLVQSLVCNNVLLTFVVTFFCSRTSLFSQIDPVTLCITPSIMHCPLSFHLWGTIDLFPSHSVSDNCNNKQPLCCQGQSTDNFW